MEFFQLDANADSGKWFLRAPVSEAGDAVDARVFGEGVCFNSDENLLIQTRRDGWEVDINFADFDMVVINKKIGELITSFPNISVQLVPVQIEGSSSDWQILNTLQRIRSIDEETSVFTRWTLDDGRPERVGEYRMFVKLRINRAAAEGAHLFRIDEWPGPLVVSRTLRESLEKRRTTGITFRPLT